ncbi:GNAT family N-acetyltransferase [Arachidicoccus soli]|uniref:GNAT family N-acetyltransferase n=1 Tax=Arachidicoccus soli TaxID=2341117 RepID=A0A386HPV9_9BACT|nr:GNAT family N-acetyltransferase [Arachidicoccus soli]AYD47988.1 GNAT family N-acetyltransferase [Arachidicoccus soli]
MYFQFIRHKDLTLDQLDEICKIKKQVWNYSIVQHKDWIKSNLKENDIHVLMKDQSYRNIAYLNLVDCKIILNNKERNVRGLGNVCTIQSGKGNGTVLMNFINRYLIENEDMGFLFCKKSLLNFYTRIGWKIVEQKYLLFPLFNSDQIFTLTFNFKNEKINFLEYSGKLF